MSENQVRNHLGSKWTTEEYIQWNVMIEVTIEVMIIYRLLHDYEISRDNSIIKSIKTKKYMKQKLQSICKYHLSGLKQISKK